MMPKNVTSPELRACFESIPGLAEKHASRATESRTDLFYCTLPIKSEWISEVAGQFDKVQFAIDEAGRMLLLGWSSDSDECAVIPVSFQPRL